MKDKKRVVVTGMGVVSSLGNDAHQFYQKLLTGTSGVTAIERFSCVEYPSRIASMVDEFDQDIYLDKKNVRRVDRSIAYAIVAGKKAVEDAGFDLKDLSSLDKKRSGSVIGSGVGGMAIFADGVHNLEEKGWRKVTPFFIPYILTNMPGALLAKELGIMGPSYSISTACATSNNSIIAAANHIRAGDTDLMLAGGVEAPIIPMGLAGFCACKALSQRNDEPEKASRPWDKGRDGFVMAEGGAVLVLESLEHAKKRGARIYAEYRGGGLSCDAYHFTEPRPDGQGVALCIAHALEDAQVRPEEVNYINAHATSTPAGDMVEIRATKQIFSHANKIVINATKSMTGHSLGASGGFEAIATLKAIEQGVVHPTINLEDPEEELDFIAPTKMREHSIDVAISNSFGFGGHNATIVFSPFKD